MPGVRCVALLIALSAGLVGITAGAPAVAAPIPAAWSAHTSGPHAAAYRCAGRWSPIQAKVSGFVVGNCRGGTAVRGIGLDRCAPGCQRGARSEGPAWAAVALPRSSHFAACGWMNVKNRLDLGGTPPPGRCGRGIGPDQPLPDRYVKRFTGASLAGAPRPTSQKYAGLWVWAGRFTDGAHRGQEGGGLRYRPQFRDPTKTCRAYANVNPWMPWQRVRASERMWSVHDGSRHLTIRYVGRFRVADQHGRLQWWVNVHSSAPEDRARPWGFVAASCLFDGPTPRALATAHRQRPPAAARCGFGVAAFHEIVRRRGISCVRAKEALRSLRGPHHLAPIACHAARDVRGWHLTNVVRDPSLGITRYTAKGRSFDFLRHQFPGEIWCPA
ncbi:MAG: hypothetical protein AAGC46_04490 [Solirubrobacteraceae bacterium]|nr:hypothetical protein [Patulibacter sp.]